MRAIICALILCVTSPVLAETLTYAGRLTSADGTPVAVWPHLSFTLHDEQGSVLWSTFVDRDVLSMSADADGNFSVVLDVGEYADGRAGPIEPELAGRAHALSVAVCDVLPCVDPPTLGRPQRLDAVPRALHAAVAEDVMPGAVAGAVYQLDDLIVTAEPTPGEYGSLPEALAALDGRLLPPWRDITIRVGPGTFRHDEPVVIERPDAQRLRIVGAGSGETMLWFPSSHGVEVAAGLHLGELRALTIAGQRGGEGDARGVIVHPGAQLRLGADTVVQDFDEHCVYARGSTLIAHDVRVRNCGSSGVMARSGARVLCDRASVVDAATGFSADEHSLLRCYGCRAEETSWYGFLATEGSVVKAEDAAAVEIGREVYHSERAGFVDARGALPEGWQQGEDPSFVLQ